MLMFIVRTLGSKKDADRAPLGTHEKTTHNEPSVRCVPQLLAQVLTAVTIQDFRVPICPSTGRRVIPECCRAYPLCLPILFLVILTVNISSQRFFS